jgi:crotonobetainyl-CoA:carnitine CoA-transferase CaiB-like acyl-CoA transferase
MPAIFISSCDYKTLSKQRPRLIYAWLTAHGMQGPDVDQPGYDIGAFWARSGLMDLLRSSDEPGGMPPRYPGGNGDHTSSLSLIAAVMGALFHRERTGKGQLVETSLLKNGIWTLATPITAFSGMKSRQFRSPRRTAYNPCLNNYTCKGGRQVQLLGQQPLRHFEPLLAALGLRDRVLGSNLDINKWIQGEIKGETPPLCSSSSPSFSFLRPAVPSN